MNAKTQVECDLIGEAGATGFSHIDQEVTFFSQVAALLEPHHKVLDFGAGRGEWFEDDPVRYRREIQNFRGRAAHVDGCDIDPVVHENRTLDVAATFAPGASLPYEDNRFDLVVSRYVFEHLSDPEWAARELLRVTKPGGWICAMTPNRTGYVALAARVTPNKKHARVLGNIQPQRKSVDVFPTVYRLNTPGAIRQFFGDSADIFLYRASGVPSYYFGNRTLFRVFQLIHRLLPPVFASGLYVLMRKR